MGRWAPGLASVAFWFVELAQWARHQGEIEARCGGGRAWPMVQLIVAEMARTPGWRRICLQIRYRVGLMYLAEAAVEVEEEVEEAVVTVVAALVSGGGGEGGGGGFGDGGGAGAGAGGTGGGGEGRQRTASARVQ